MKSIFNKEVMQQILQRIDRISPDAKNIWGKMTAYQMVKHCTVSEEMFLGKKVYKRLFIGRLFGKIALKGILKNDAPMKLNNPTHPEFKITGQGDFEGEKQKWKLLLQEYENFSNQGFVHPFFGKMNTKQIGEYVFKHCDHHLRQFNV